MCTYEFDMQLAQMFIDKFDMQFAQMYIYEFDMQLAHIVHIRV